MSPRARHRLALANLWLALLIGTSCAIGWAVGVLGVEAMVGITMVLSFATHFVSSLDWAATTDVRVQQEETPP